jgi:hypothetical protein
VLLPQATELEEVDGMFRSLLTEEKIDETVSLIPDSWLLIDSPFDNADEHRSAYAKFLKLRVRNSELFVKEAQNARK